MQKSLNYMDLYTEQNMHGAWLVTTVILFQSKFLSAAFWMWSMGSMTCMPFSLKTSSLLMKPQHKGPSHFVITGSCPFFRG